jgi:hypothetical protein
MSKVDKARELIEQTPSGVLSRLSAKEHRELFDLLNANPLPAFTPEYKTGDPTELKLFQKNPTGLEYLSFAGQSIVGWKPDPKRVALQKLMCATSLHPTFVSEDEGTRVKMIDKLKVHKKEFSEARDNWDIMTDNERLDVLKKAAQAQADAFGSGLPQKGIVFGATGAGEAGGYSGRNLKDGDDSIKLNRDDSYLKDFATALETIFHEMTHRYQHTLVLRLKSAAPSGTTGSNQQITAQNEPMLYNQTKMFETDEMPNGRISPAESKARDGNSAESYKKQPKEAPWRGLNRSACSLRCFPPDDSPELPNWR